jgi:hypothetical protein
LRVTGHPHCGYCSQCVDRRFSFLAAGLAEFDQDTRYSVDVFTDPLPAGEARQVGLSYLAFAQQTAKQTEDEIFETHQELIERGVDTGPGIELKMYRVAQLLHRHSKEVMDALGTVIGEHREELANRTLPEDGLLRLYLADIDRSPEAPDPSSMPVQSEPENDPAIEIDRDRSVVEVTWGGISASYALRIGFLRLLHLIANPKQVISCIELVRLADRTSTDSATLTDEDLSDGFHPDYLDNLGPLADVDTQRVYRNRMTELRKSIKEAKAANDDILARKHEQELQEIKRAMKEVTGLFGRLRDDPASHSEKARKAVSRTIHQALDQIAGAQPELGNHLTRSIEFGSFCVYRPHPHQSWRIAA